MATHAEVNIIINRLHKAGVRGRKLEALSATARQWQRCGLDAAAIAHLIGSVPVRGVSR